LKLEARNNFKTNLEKLIPKSHAFCYKFKGRKQRNSNRQVSCFVGLSNGSINVYSVTKNYYTLLNGGHILPYLTLSLLANKLYSDVDGYIIQWDLTTTLKSLNKAHKSVSKLVQNFRRLYLPPLISTSNYGTWKLKLVLATFTGHATTHLHHNEW
jgi:hypothetical protein